MSTKINLAFMKDKWPSEIVAREEVGRFTGGVMTPKTQANLDSVGEGPTEVIRIGRKVAYPLTSYIKWLESRASWKNQVAVEV
jgi:hypothetical protein